MNVQTCAIPSCGKPAPYGYRKPGPLSAQPTRGYLWVCADHRETAEQRRAKALGLTLKETA